MRTTENRMLSKERGPMRKKVSIGCAVAAAITFSLFFADAALAQSRGELLYKAHCVSCHTAQVHWRDNRLANNWVGLKYQVRRWQEAASLAWNDSDLLDVSRFLNESVYHFAEVPEPEPSAKRIEPDARRVRRPAATPSASHAVTGH